MEVLVKKKLVLKELEKLREKNTPRAGNRCKNKNCDGEVVKEVASLSHGQYSFHSPTCEKCGRTYTHAQNVRKVGIEKFERVLTEPFTI